MISRLYVDNFRCLTNFELKLDQMQLLLGDNGTGKSTALAAVEILCRIATDPAADLAALLPATSRTRWDRRMDQAFELDIVVEGRTYRYALRVTHESLDGMVRVVSESIRQGDRPLYESAAGRVRLYRDVGEPIDLGFSLTTGRGLLAMMHGPSEIRAVRDALSRVTVLHLDPRRMGSDATKDSKRLSSDGSDFAAWYLRFVTSDPGAQNAYFTTLTEVLPGFRTLKFEAEGRSRTLQLVFETGSTRYVLRFDELSEGQRTLVVLYALLEELAANGGTLWIDEPVNHLALGEIQPWLVEVSERLGSSGQVVLVSHHPDLIDYMAARDAVVFSRPAGGPARVMPLSIDRDEGLTASEVVRKRLLTDD